MIRTRRATQRLVAQDVEAVFPELVFTDSRNSKGIGYGHMTAVLVEAIKELKAENDALKSIVCTELGSTAEFCQQ